MAIWLKPLNHTTMIKKFIKNNWILIIVIIYVLSPFDFAPEAILGPIGLLDDSALLIFEVARRIKGNKETA